MKTIRPFLAAVIGSAALAGCMMVPEQTLLACQNEIAEWAEPHDPVRIETVRSGHGRRQLNGDVVTPLNVRIVYDRQGGLETRQAQIDCTVNDDGAVVAVTEP